MSRITNYLQNIKRFAQWQIVFWKFLFRVIQPLRCQSYVSNKFNQINSSCGRFDRIAWARTREFSTPKWLCKWNTCDDASMTANATVAWWFRLSASMSLCAYRWRCMDRRRRRRRRALWFVVMSVFPCGRRNVVAGTVAAVEPLSRWACVCWAAATTTTLNVICVGLLVSPSISPDERRMSIVEPLSRWTIEPLRAVESRWVWRGCWQIWCNLRRWT